MTCAVIFLHDCHLPFLANDIIGIQIEKQAFFAKNIQKCRLPLLANDEIGKTSRPGA